MENRRFGLCIYETEPIQNNEKQANASHRIILPQGTVLIEIPAKWLTHNVWC